MQVDKVVDVNLVKLLILLAKARGSPIDYVVCDVWRVM
jgi:hypothetical protein